MKFAKASSADLDMAFTLTNAIDTLTDTWFPSMPEEIEKNPHGGSEPFDRDDDAQCGRALRHLLDIADRGSLSRVVGGMAVLLDPRNKCVDPNADTLERHPDVVQMMEAKRARLLEEWNESHGNVLWWRFPVDEPPYCGSPICSDWPGYHTHWTSLIVPEAPSSDVASKG